MGSRASSDADVGMARTRLARSVPSYDGSAIRIHTGSWVEARALNDLAVDDSLVGRTIDHFIVESLVGQGGMGAVYLAHDTSLDRKVALKVLRPELARDRDLAERLVREARAQARLSHPNVVGIHYIGHHEGVPYLAMEYVRGQSLDDHLREVGALPWPVALEYVIQAARALRAASRTGIIHRDVKPSNLILAVPDEPGAADRDVRVADFGLAARGGGNEGGFIGTPHYASPEQIDGRSLDHRSDIYALGITFYELVVGARPFEARTVAELFEQHKTAPRPEIPVERAPPRVRALCAAMMAADPAARPPTWDALIERLEALRPRHFAAGAIVPRGLALAIDLALVETAAQAAAGMAQLSQLAANTIALSAFALYYVFAHKLLRATVGKRLMGLSLQGLRRAPTWKAIVARFVVAFWGPILALVMLHLQVGATTDLDALRSALQGAVGIERVPLLEPGLGAVLQTLLVPNVLVAVPWLGGFVLAFFVGQRQALHDLVAGTRVVVGGARRSRRTDRAAGGTSHGAGRALPRSS